MGNYSTGSDMIIIEKDGEKKCFFFNFHDFFVNFDVFLSFFADFCQSTSEYQRETYFIVFSTLFYSRKHFVFACRSVSSLSKKCFKMLMSLFSDFFFQKTTNYSRLRGQIIKMKIVGKSSINNATFDG